MYTTHFSFFQRCGTAGTTMTTATNGGSTATRVASGRGTASTAVTAQGRAHARQGQTVTPEAAAAGTGPRPRTRPPGSAAAPSVRTTTPIPRTTTAARRGRGHPRRETKAVRLPRSLSVDATLDPFDPRTNLDLSPSPPRRLFVSFVQPVVTPPRPARPSPHPPRSWTPLPNRQVRTAPR